MEAAVIVPETGLDNARAFCPSFVTKCCGLGLSNLPVPPDVSQVASIFKSGPGITHTAATTSSSVYHHVKRLHSIILNLILFFLHHPTTTQHTAMPTPLLLELEHKGQNFMQALTI